MRLATPRRTRLQHLLGINIALSVASFALGAIVTRVPISFASGASERELVSGAVSAAANKAGAAAAQHLASVDATAAAAVSPGTAEPAHGKSKGAASLPSWAEVAADAQSWTATVRADTSYGAGVIVARSGFVLTNLHVVANARAITVTPFAGTPLSARLVDSDSELDVALLSVAATTPLPAAAHLGSSAKLAVGDEVLAVGSPRKMYFSVSRGMVSFPNRLLEGVEYVQTDLPINEGNSGGPLVDREGRVVGIVSFILRESQGLSFALPIDRAVNRFSSYLSPHRASGPAVHASAEAVSELGTSASRPAQEPPSRELPARRRAD